MPIFDYTCPKCKRECEALVLRNASGELNPVTCTCKTTMERKPNLTHFPGMQSGKHHFGGGQTIMKRRKKNKEE